MALAVTVQILVPLLLVGVIAFTRQPGRLRWLGTVVAFGMVISYLLVSARWDLSSVYMRPMIVMLFIAAGFVGYRRIRKPETKAGIFQSLVFWTITLSLMILMSGFLWFSLRGFFKPDGAVDLASPLQGRHLVLNGGASPFTNAHFRIRPQDYALDIIGVNAFGGRAVLSGDPRNLETYVIYGQPVFSPCDGKITVMVDDKPDLVPPERDTENLAGNHILIECDDYEVLMAHLMQGSVRVQVNEQVVIGTPLGRVGNSGNTSEPHLHIHAERGGEPGIILNGTAVPITIGGRFLVRNNVFGNHL